MFFAIQEGCFKLPANFQIMSFTILGIESSCDDTSAAVLRDGVLLSNVIAGQEVHRFFGGVVPELASRAHQQNIIPVVDTAIKKAGISAGDIDAVAFTRGPGLMGSLLVGISFAKGFALGLQIPLIEVNHLQAHILAHFIKESPEGYSHPSFPFICLLVSGGHTQLVLVRDFFDMEIIGQTIDDAAGEAFDKCAKIMGLGYPGGPVVDKLAETGNPRAISFARPRTEGLNFSFSGLKTSFLYFVRDREKEQPGWMKNNLEDLCASLQFTICDILSQRIFEACRLTGIREIAIAGGVSANSELKKRITSLGIREGIKTHIPPARFTTDNAAMIAIAGHYKFLKGDFAPQSITPFARFTEF